MGSTVVELTIAGDVELTEQDRHQLGLRSAVRRTVLQATVRDHAALYGLVQRLAALGLELVELRTASRDSRVEVVVRGNVGELLRSTLANVVDGATPAATTVHQPPEETVRLLTALAHAAALPTTGEDRRATTGQGGVRRAHRDVSRAADAGREVSMHRTMEEMGPIDWLVVAFPDNRLDGTALPLLIDLVDRGVIRILDLAFLTKDDAGQIEAVQLHDLEVTADFDLTIFEGAASGLLDDDDLLEAGEALPPGSAAGLLVYENSWAAPFASAMRRGGGSLVAGGRIPIQSLIAALDEAEGGPPASLENG